MIGPVCLFVCRIIKFWTDMLEVFFFLWILHHCERDRSALLEHALGVLLLGVEKAIGNYVLT